MNYLEKVKVIVSLTKIEKSTEELKAGKYIGLGKSSLEKEWDIDLSNPLSTSPRKLFGKTYRELDRDEVAEYSQIKRLMRRNNFNGQ